MARCGIDEAPDTVHRREDAAALLILVGLLGWLLSPALGLPFRNADDFLHLDVALGLLGGESGALWAVTHGYGDSDVLRWTPWSLWTLDAALFGGRPAGYYATNVALQIGLSVATYALVRGLGGRPWAALPAGAWVGLNVATGQGVYFLGSRDDQCAALCVVMAAAAWAHGGGSRRGRGAATLALALACLSKPPAAAGLFLLVAVDRLRWRSRPSAFAAPLAVVTVYGLAVAAVVGRELLGEAAGGGVDWAWDPELLRRLGALVAPGWAVRLPGRTLAAQSAPLLLAAAVGMAASVRRGGSWRLALAAGAWLLLTLPIPLLWMATHLGDGDDSGRQWLLPSVGVALAVAATVPRARRWGVPAGLVLAVACGLRFSSNADAFLDRRDEAVHRFLEAWAQGPDDRGLVAFQRPHAGLNALVTSGAMARLAGEGVASVLRQGDGFVRDVVPERWGYGSLEEEGRPFRWERAEGPILVDEHGDDGPRFRWVQAEDTGRPGATLMEWEFESGPAGWSGWPRPGVAVHRPMRGWQLARGRVLDEGQVAPILGQGERPAALLSPELGLDPRSVCGVEIDHVGPPPMAPRWRPMGARLVPSGRFSLLTWSQEADFSDGYRGALVVPLGESVRLDNAPTWRSSDWVRRIAIVPSNTAEPATVRAVRLLRCEAGEG